MEQIRQNVSFPTDNSFNRRIPSLSPVFSSPVPSSIGPYLMMPPTLIFNGPSPSFTNIFPCMPPNSSPPTAFISNQPPFNSMCNLGSKWQILPATFPTQPLSEKYHQFSVEGPVWRHQLHPQINPTSDRFPMYPCQQIDLSLPKMNPAFNHSFYPIFKETPQFISGKNTETNDTMHVKQSKSAVLGNLKRGDTKKNSNDASQKRYRRRKRQYYKNSCNSVAQEQKGKGSVYMKNKSASVPREYTKVNNSKSRKYVGKQPNLCTSEIEPEVN